MSIEVLKQELAGLAPKERSQIMAYLLSLEDEQNTVYRAALTEKIDDKNPKRWMSLDELDRRLSQKTD
jgi:hypothetical protein